jgi:hypothetical protein
MRNKNGSVKKILQLKYELLKYRNYPTEISKTNKNLIAYNLVKFKK